MMRGSFNSAQRNHDIAISAVETDELEWWVSGWLGGRADWICFRWGGLVAGRRGSDIFHSTVKIHSTRNKAIFEMYFGINKSAKNVDKTVQGKENLISNYYPTKTSCFVPSQRIVFHSEEEKQFQPETQIPVVQALPLLHPRPSTATFQRGGPPVVGILLEPHPFRNASAICENRGSNRSSSPGRQSTICDFSNRDSSWPSGACGRSGR